MTAPVPADCLMRLDHLRVLALEGADTAAFLQGQLTCDVAALAPGRAGLGAWCSAKGRALASFVLWTDGARHYLVLPEVLAAPIAKRLAMFVLRAKVRVSQADLACFGLRGAAAAPLLAGLLDRVPAAPWGQSSQGERQLVALPEAAGGPRWLLCLPAADLAGFDAASAALPRADAELWRWLDIRAGLPQVLPATQDKFVPQMLNLEALDGVSFRKGCYPGQEVVARSQFLGKLKRRTLLAHAAALPPAAGSDVLDATGNPAGLVVNAAAAPTGGSDLLVEVQLEGRAEPLRLPDGAELALSAPPYPLPDNEVFVRPRL